MPCSGSAPFLPTVSVDVSRAFDSVDIQLLLSLVEPLLRHEQYLVLKYWEVLRCCSSCRHCTVAGKQG